MDSKSFNREEALRVIAAKNAQKKVNEKIKLKKYVMLRPSPLKKEVLVEDDDDNW